MLVGVVAGQTSDDLVEAQFRQQGDAVETLLAVGFHIVAKRLDLGARELLVDRLDLLAGRRCRGRFRSANG
ncbi:hypothetical protein [Mesorhizobium sp. ORM16]|uniref:hypothetical protein n=1 Tax=Mesorhizobium sp. ORM16 TaxID=3376989 RepID=UPI00385782E5